MVILIAVGFITSCSSEAAPAEPDSLQSSASLTELAVPTPTIITPPAEEPFTKPTDTAIVPVVVAPIEIIIIKPAVPTPIPVPPTPSPSGSSCPGASPQRLEVGSNAYVCTISDPVRLREGPGKQYNSIASLEKGSQLYVVDGPRCADNWSWWQVETESGNIGWMAEGGDNIDPYFLCPK